MFYNNNNSGNFIINSLRCPKETRVDQIEFQIRLMSLETIRGEGLIGLKKTTKRKSGSYSSCRIHVLSIWMATLRTTIEQNNPFTI